MTNTGIVASKRVDNSRMQHEIWLDNKQVSNQEIFELVLKHNLLFPLMREVLIDQALAADDIGALSKELSEAERQLCLQQFKQQHGLNSEEDIRQHLATRGLHMEQLPELLIRPLLVQKLKQKQFAGQAETVFIEKKDQLDRVIYSLIRTSEPGIIQELYYRILDEPSSFSSLAKQYSEGPEASTGGLIGPVEMQDVHGLIAQQLKSASIGELILPKLIGKWYVLLRKEKNIPARLDKKIKQRLVNELFESWLRKQIQTQIRVECDE